MKALRWLALAALMASAACGDDGQPANPDASTDADNTDAPPAVTFTSFVIDLVLNQTAANTEAKPYSDFESLTDPDQDNPNAYEALFP